MPFKQHDASLYVLRMTVINCMYFTQVSLTPVEALLTFSALRIVLWSFAVHINGESLLVLAVWEGRPWPSGLRQEGDDGAPHGSAHRPAAAQEQQQPRRAVAGQVRGLWRAAHPGYRGVDRAHRLITECLTS